MINKIIYFMNQEIGTKIDHIFCFEKVLLNSVSVV